MFFAHGLVPLLLTGALRLALFDAAGLDPRALSVLQSRVGELLAPAGVTVEWLDIESLRASADDGDGDRSPRGTGSRYLKVIVWPGDPERWGLSDRTMGAVIDPRSPPEAVYLFVAVIQRTLTTANTRPSRPLAHDRSGRAFGVSLAHELVHALAPDLEHAVQGVFRASLDARALTSAQLDLDGTSALALARGVRRFNEEGSVAEARGSSSPPRGTATSAGTPRNHESPAGRRRAAAPNGGPRPR